MYYFVRSRSALAFVCALACLFFFYATSTPLRRVVAQEERRVAERRRPAQSGPDDVPAGLRAAIEKTRADEGRGARLEADDASAQYSSAIDPFVQQQRLQASDAAAGDIFGFTVSVDGETAIVGAYLDNNSGGSDAGSAYVFVRSNGVWSQQQQLRASDAASGDIFGTSVCVSGDTIIVGADGNDNSGGIDSGAAYVFTRSNGVWTQQQRLQAPDAAPGDGFGSASSVSGETLIVGAGGDDNSGGTDAGSAYIFTRSNGVWTEQQRLQSSASSGDRFGNVVSVSGETAIVGAYLDDNSGGTDAGSVYVFVRSGATWTEQQRLQASGASSGDIFGASVSLSGDTLIAGSYLDTHTGGQAAGSAYIFTRSNGVWTEQQRLQASDASSGDLFGNAVSVSGDIAVVGADEDDHSGGQGAGSAYVFTRSNGMWTEQQRLQASDPASGDVFSRAVSVSGETIFVGADGNDNGGGANAGAAYVFVKGTDVWGRQEQLHPPQSISGAAFGNAVAINGDTAIVVAWEHDNNDVGVGTGYFFTRCAGVWSLQQRVQVTEADGAAFQSVALDGNTAIFGSPGSDRTAGVVYVFTRSGGVWTQQQRLQASDATGTPVMGNGQGGDFFGTSVSVSGDTAIVGAHEDDNSGGTDAGSAYVFTRSNGVWTEQQRLQASDATTQDFFGWSVSISGETAIVGAYQASISTSLHFGSAYIFQRSNGVWTQQQGLQPSGPVGSNTRFGYSVAISGETALVGTSAADTGRIPTTGAAYVFHRSGGVWIEQQRLQASDAAANDLFGVAVAISGDNAIVGASVDDNSGGPDAGSAYIFTRSGGVWREQRRLQASDAAPQDSFGSAVAISGETAIVGADSHDSGSQNTGAAYIFGTPPPASPVLISEFRLAGPGVGGTGAGTDEFVELYNNTDAAITVGTTDGSAGWTLRSSDATLNHTIPNGDVIPARGHYLVVNSLGYSLAPYPTSQHACPGGNCAYGNRTFTSDTPLNTGLALFRTAHPANFTHANRLDAAGPSTEADALYREGEGYAPVTGNAAAVQHSLVRNLLSGTPRDCDEKDFQLVATNGAATLHGALLGAPGPQNTDSPVQRNGAIKASLVDATQPSFAAPNRVRHGAADPSEPANSTRGTLKIRRKFTNTTGAEVTRLRFRVVDITTTPRRNGEAADLRVLHSSGGVNLTLSDGLVVPLIALTREEPPAQSTDGGGFNTTLSATLAQAIPHKASIYVEFNLGVIEDGNFSFRVNVEALTGAPTNSQANSKADPLRKPSKSTKAGALRPPTP